MNEQEERAEFEAMLANVTTEKPRWVEGDQSYDQYAHQQSWQVYLAARRTQDEQVGELVRLVMAANEDCPCCLSDLSDLSKHLKISPTCPFANIQAQLKETQDAK